MFDKLKVVFASLNSHDVKYIVIGGVAAIAHGSTRNTFDLDLLIQPTRENARRLLDALLSAGFGTAALITAEGMGQPLQRMLIVMLVSSTSWPRIVIDVSHVWHDCVACDDAFDTFQPRHRRISFWGQTR